MAAAPKTKRRGGASRVQRGRSCAARIQSISFHAILRIFERSFSLFGRATTKKVGSGSPDPTRARDFHPTAIRGASITLNRVAAYVVYHAFTQKSSS